VRWGPDNQEGREAGHSLHADPYEAILGEEMHVIGVMVANAAVGLGMQVHGYDPYLSVEAAWSLSRQVGNAKSLNSLVAHSDYLTVHVPQTEKTKGLMNAEKFGLMKKGVRLINLSRGGLVVESDLLDALDRGIIGQYVTDFASKALLQNDGVICFPHLGASTPEAEENCAEMVTDQVREFLEDGTITNSVNFPACRLERAGGERITIINRNVPAMVGQISTVLADARLNIAELINKSRDQVAYNIFDLEGNIPREVLKKIAAIEGVVRVRKI